MLTGHNIEPEVLAIAKKVRSWAEEKALEWEFPSDLMGMCAIASAKLHESLKHAGFPSKIGYNPDHCFVIYKGFVLDVTATQFKEEEPVMVARRNDYWFHNEEHVFADVVNLKRIQRQHRWPRSQRVTRMLEE